MHRPPSIHTIIRVSCAVVIALIVGTGAYLAYTYSASPSVSSVAIATSPTQVTELPQTIATHAVAKRPTVTQATPTHSAGQTSSTPGATSQPTKAPCGVSCNPWGYSFHPGTVITYPPSNFCAYFACIPSFWESDDPGDGYVIECGDHLFSQSGSEQGACSGHGGVLATLYAPGQSTPTPTPKPMPSPSPSLSPTPTATP